MIGSGLSAARGNPGASLEVRTGPGDGRGEGWVGGCGGRLPPPLGVHQDRGRVSPGGTDAATRRPRGCLERRRAGVPDARDARRGWCQKKVELGVEERDGVECRNGPGDGLSGEDGTTKRSEGQRGRRAGGDEDGLDLCCTVGRVEGARNHTQRRSRRRVSTARRLDDSCGRVRDTQKERRLDSGARAPPRRRGAAHWSDPDARG